MAIRKLSDVNLLRLKKAFQNELEARGHNLTQFDLTSDDFTTKLFFEIDNFYKHSHSWSSLDVLGKEFKNIVDEVLSGFHHEKHVARTGRRID